jgi:glycosyltransferase involved in cell wall biosynthesis
VPLVSIVLPTYNGARYIRECIDSCLGQTFRDLELIVVVDGSTDQTEAILRTYQDPRLRTLKTPNRGQATAMNTGFEIARGAYWSWTSDDNIYFPDALEVMVRHLTTHTEVAAVSTDCLVINETGKAISYEEFPWQCFLYRADNARKVGPHRPEARIIEDLDFFLRLRHLGGPIMRISRPYLKYRVHKNMVTQTKAAERPLVSLKLNYDLAALGIVDVDLQWLFLSRMSQAALYRNHEAMQNMVEFAREAGAPFLELLEKRKRFLQSQFGWLVNRIGIAFVSQARKARGKFKLLRYLLGETLGGQAGQSAYRIWHRSLQ